MFEFCRTGLQIESLNLRKKDQKKNLDKKDATV